jgi:two-component system, sensor histidine kinase and response regulator
MINTITKVNSVIAHDLRDSLISISGISDILLDNWETFSQEEKLEIIREIKETSDTTMRLLSDLLEWSKSIAKICGPVIKPFNATKVIRSMVELSNPKLKRKDLEIRNLITEDIFVVGDENMFASIIRNLLANSLKSCLKRGIIEIAATLSGSFCRVCIADNGVGMTKDQIDKLFPGKDDKTDSYCVSGDYCNGFGLIICRDFIRINNGELWAESAKGQGTRVFFTFPLNK